MSVEIWVLEGARTPMRKFLGDFRSTTAIELGSVAAREAIARAGVDAAQIEHVVMGNALQTSTDAIYGARHVGLAAGVPEATPALTVNRLCGSGIESIVQLGRMIQAGEIHVGLAGGMENMTMAPHVVYGARQGFRMKSASLQDSLVEALMDSQCGCTMSMTSDNVARQYGISREQQDEFALRSQHLAAAAQDAGRLAEEIVPVQVSSRGRTREIDRDDHLRADVTLESLAALQPAFGPESFVTAGNASGIVDGGAAVVVAGADWARSEGHEPLGRVVSWAAVGVDPSRMGIGPVPATKAALQSAGWNLEDVDLVEVNEAFAGQYLAVEQQLGLDRDRVNVNGGAIALGHPLGMTGTRLVYTLLRELHRRGGGRALATACIGGGQGIAICLESR